MFRRDIMLIVVAGVAMGGLIAYHAIEGTEVPIWQALAVAAVNVVASIKLVLGVRKNRLPRPPSKPD
jgi:Na+-transporting NADH:ubiquinone oxidoreductase subunit NqrB